MSTRQGTVQKFGRIPDIDSSGGNEEVWDGEGAYSFLAAATTLSVASSSTDDDVAGTGALTAVVIGLDDSYNEISQTVTLTGQTEVELPVDLIRVYRAYVATAGTGNVNAGNVWVGSGTFTSGVPANKYAGILAGNGQTLMAVYTVPATSSAGGRVIRWYGSVGAGQAAYATIALQTKEFGGAWRTRRVSGIGEGGPIDENLQWLSADGDIVGGIGVGAKADIRIRVLANGVNNSTIQAGFDMELLS